MSLDTRARDAVTETKRRVGRISVPDPGRWVRRTRRRHVAQRTVGALLVVGLVGGATALWVTGRDGTDNMVETPPVAPVESETVDGWTRIEKAEAGMEESADIGDVVAGGPGFVAVGSEVGGRGWRPAIWTSPDGHLWQRAETGLARDEYGSLNSVAVGPSGMVAIGFANEVDLSGNVNESAPIVLRSDDGREWQEAARGAASGPDRRTGWGMVGVVAGGPGFIAYGTSDEVTAAIWTSPDGARWTRVLDEPSLVPAWVDALTPTSEGYVALGHEGDPPSSVVAWVSPDGVTWTRTGENAGIDFRVAAVAEKDDRLLAAESYGARGEVEDPRGGVSDLWESSDGGRTWGKVSEFSAAFPRAGVAGLLIFGEFWLVAGAATSQGEPANHVDAWVSTDARGWTSMPAELHDFPGGILGPGASDGERAVLFGLAPEFRWFYVWEPGANEDVPHYETRVLDEGECFDNRTEMLPVPCDEPHTAELFAVYTHPDPIVPGEPAPGGRCHELFEEYTGLPVDPEEYSVLDTSSGGGPDGGIVETRCYIMGPRGVAGPLLIGSAKPE